jgi:hypothetical protein
VSDLRLCLWAHEDLNLGPLPCQGVNRGLCSTPDKTSSQVGGQFSLSTSTDQYRPLYGWHVAHLWPERARSGMNSASWSGTEPRPPTAALGFIGLSARPAPQAVGGRRG